MGIITDSISYTLGNIVTIGAASVTWLQDANEYAKFAASIIAILVGIVTLIKFFRERKNNNK
jgi:peptidoglycan biosynthesis protein MviN/MurJ (putative lipid II flippase)